MGWTEQGGWLSPLAGSLFEGELVKHTQCLSYSFNSLSCTRSHMGGEMG